VNLKTNTFASNTGNLTFDNWNFDNHALTNIIQFGVYEKTKIMERFWNFIFYATWVTLRDMSINLISNPINYVIVKIYPKKRKKEFKNFQNYMKNDKKSEMYPEKSKNISHAFKFMLISTTVSIGVIIIIINYFIDFQFENSAFLGLFGAMSLSIFMNYYFLYSNNNYLTYFKLIGNQKTPFNSYVIAFMFHVVPLFTLMFLALKK